MSLQRHDQRIATIIGGAIIEQIVEDAIVTHCIKDIQDNRQQLFGSPQESPITFDTKIRMAYALGIFGPNTKNDLTIIRNIRNLFAHTLSSVTFESKEVAELCGFFRYRDNRSWTVRENDSPETPSGDATKPFHIYYWSLRHYFTALATAPLIGRPFHYTDKSLHKYNPEPYFSLALS